MVSLRGSALKLLALRGRFAVEDRPVNEVELRVGLAIWLTNDLRIEVAAISLPAGHLTTVAVGSVQSPLELILRYDNAHIHREGDQPLALGGISAHILSELADMAQPLSWEAGTFDLVRSHPDPLGFVDSLRKA